MSSDDYYTIKLNADDAKWYLTHGFMSTLENGWPATIRNGDEGFDNREDALAYYNALDHGFMGSGYSEYGLIEEDYPLNTLVTNEQARAWAQKTVDTLNWYLNPEED